MSDHLDPHGYAYCIHRCVEGGCLNNSKQKLWSRNGNPLRRHAVNSRRHPKCNTSCPGHQILGRSTGKYQYQVIATSEQVAEAFKSSLGDNIEVGSDGDNEDGGDNDYEDGVGDGVDDIYDVGNIKDNIDTLTENYTKTVDKLLPSDPPPRRSSSIIALELVPREVSPPNLQEPDKPNIVDLNDDGKPTAYTTKQSDAKKTFVVIYVPDPTRCHSTATSASVDLAFIRTTINIEQWKSIKHLEGTVFEIKTRTPSPNNSVSVYMQEWVRFPIDGSMHCFFCSTPSLKLCVMIRLARAKNINTGDTLFVVEYMSWSDFRNAMVEDLKNKRIWERFAQADCLVGGVDISLSYL